MKLFASLFLLLCIPVIKWVTSCFRSTQLRRTVAASRGRFELTSVDCRVWAGGSGGRNAGQFASRSKDESPSSPWTTPKWDLLRPLTGNLEKNEIAEGIYIAWGKHKDVRNRGISAWNGCCHETDSLKANSFKSFHCTASGPVCLSAARMSTAVTSARPPCSATARACKPISAT